MDRQCRLSNVTKDYLTEYFCILDKMIEDMGGAELCGSVSRNFIVQMIPHHRAAIEMSENILKYTTNLAVQDIALEIVSEQTKGIEEMREMLPCCEKLCNSEQDIRLYERAAKNIMNTMFCGMKNAGIENCVNCNFIREMLPHHMGAVELSKNALKFSVCPELIPILKEIIKSQEKGIAQMNRLRRRLNCG